MLRYRVAFARGDGMWWPMVFWNVQHHLPTQDIAAAENTAMRTGGVGARQSHTLPASGGGRGYS